MGGPTFRCGPLLVRVEATDSVLQSKLAESLNLYGVIWQGPRRIVELRVARTPHRAQLLAGRYLNCARMKVDAIADGLRASTVSGASAVGCLDVDGDRWRVSVPEAAVESDSLEDVEDIAMLVLTTGWRRTGRVPVHAAAVTSNGQAVVICAPTGGGKSTLCASLVARGWRTLGDDKLLLDLGDRPILSALQDTFNLDPAIRHWLPEVGDLTALPRYSSWTDKRRVRLADIWPGALELHAEPTKLVELQRDDGMQGLRLSPLGRNETLALLLRQTVVPGDRATARQILEGVGRMAARLAGVRVIVGRDAYAEATTRDELDAFLR